MTVSEMVDRAIPKRIYRAIPRISSIASGTQAVAFFFRSGKPLLHQESVS